MSNKPVFKLQENSTFKSCYFSGGLPTLPEVYKQHMKKPLSESINAKNTDKLAFMLMDLAERMLEELHQVTTSP
ncbi:MAG: hypothetical protein Q7T35_02955, partial [Nitrosomonas sp.]|nr:hypothetical protein [Nitrosomonas sp.]